MKMRNKISMKKHVVLVICLILLFIIFIYLYFQEVSYELNYEINDISINERYDKDLKAYFFNIYYNDKNYELVSIEEYSNKRKLIEDIITSENDDEVCLSFKTNGINLYSICSNEEEYYMNNIANQEKFTTNDTYENININELDDKTYLLWNYHDFIYLNNNTKEKLTLFSKDIYNLSLIYAFDNYLLIPDYEQNYLFDKLYVIDTNRARINSINLRFDVYFDSYFLGNDKNDVYIYDLRENQEFYIDLDKEEIYTSKNQILVDGDWKNVTNQTFQNERPTFKNTKPYEITLKDSQLYLQTLDGKTTVRLTNHEVSELIKVDNLNVYYISGDILYKYNPYDGEIALLQYSEWNFNHQNMVFIFD